MKMMGCNCVGIPFSEYERILTVAKEKGAKDIRFKAKMKDGRPLSVTEICGESDSSGFYLVLTAEEPKTEARTADEAVEKLLDALGLATLAGSNAEDSEIEKYCREKIATFADWLGENGHPDAICEIAAKAMLYLCAVKKEGK